MKFMELTIPGALRVIPERLEDARGWFARTYDEEAFRARALPTQWPHHNGSWNRRKGTLRGLHGVKPEFREDKLVRCVRGRIWDVLVDMRSDSPAFLRWEAVEFSGANSLALYVPSGVFHGFQTLEDDSEVLYLMSDPYIPEAASGASWNDPKLAISWPLSEPFLSERDRSYAFL